MRYLRLFRVFFVAISLLASAYTASASTFFISDASSGQLNTFDGNGNLLNSAAPTSGFFAPDGVAIGPNGNVFVVNQSSGPTDGDVYQFNGTTGALIGQFVSSSSGGLTIPSGATFGPNGNLYVADESANVVDEFDGTTGTFITQVTPTNALSSPLGMTFGPDGNLYIADGQGIERWNGISLTTFAFLDSHNSAFNATDIAFGPDGNLYATDTTQSLIRVIDGSGTDIRDFGFAALDQPIGLAFSPDGKLYVTDGQANQVHLFDPATGNLITDIAPFNGATVINSQFIAFAIPEPSTFVLGALGLAGIVGIRRRRREFKWGPWC